MSERRNILIHNPHSTRSANVKALILRLDDMGVQYEERITPSSRAGDNIDWIANVVRPGDRVFSAAGDGTASQMGEGIIRSGVCETEIAFGSYGGFNDGSASFGHVDAADFFNGHVTTRELVPIEAEMNGEMHTALFYATLGWTAGFAERFMSTNREAMQKANFKTIARMGRAAIYYLHHGYDKLPAFTIDDSGYRYDRESDILIRNSPVMAGMICGRDFMSEEKFGFHTLNVANFAQNIPYLYDSVVRKQTPSAVVEHVALKYIDPASFYLMRDGESELVHDVESLAFSKRANGPRLNVATSLLARSA